MSGDASYESWNATPNLLSFALTGLSRLFAYLLILSVSLFPVIGALLFVTLGQEVAVLTVGSLILVTVLGVVIPLFLRYTNETYELEGSMLVVTSGSFNTSTTRIDCEEITDLQLRRTPIDDYFGTGTLDIRARGESLSINSIKDPQEALTLIEKKTGERTRADTEELV